MEVTLGGYQNAAELAAARDAIERAWRQVTAAVPAEPGPAAAGFGAPLPQLGTAVTAALAAAGPDTAHTLYTAVRDEAARLGAAAAPGEHLLSVAACRLSGAAEAHLARLHATGPAAADLLPAAARIPAGQDQPDTDPLGLNPRPYQDRAGIAAARAEISRLRDEWRQWRHGAAEPDPASSTGEFAARLSAAVAHPDSDHLGFRRDAWSEALTAALAAIADPAGYPWAGGFLLGLTRAIHTHRERLGAHRGQARQAAGPYDSADAFFAGHEAASAARAAWLATPTGQRIRSLTDHQVRGTDWHTIRAAHHNLLGAHAALYAHAAGDDPGLARTAGYAAAAADACYELQLTLRRSDYQDPADQAVLESLTNATHLHAARIQAARDTGPAGQFAADVASRAAARAAGAQQPAPDREPARDTAPPEAGPQRLAIEHGHGGSVVRGTGRSDTPVQDLLRRDGFKWSGGQQFWYLPRPWTYDRRNSRVQSLKSGLERLGRTFTERGNAPAWQDGQQDAAPAPVPPGEPYPSLRHAQDACRSVLAAYGELLDTPAGSRMLTYARETRPDAAALKAAITGLRDAVREDGTPQNLSPALTACYQAAHALHEHLAAESHRAPKFTSLLGTLISRARTATSRMAATADAGEPGPGTAPAPSAPPAARTGTPPASQPQEVRGQDSLFGAGPGDPAAAGEGEPAPLGITPGMAPPAPADGPGPAAPPPASAAAPGPPDRAAGEQPYASRDDARADYAQARTAYETMRDSEARSAIFARDPAFRARAVALDTAWMALPGAVLAGPAQALAGALAEWAHAAFQLACYSYEPEDAERQPGFRGQVDEAASQAARMASRMAATAAAGGFPEENRAPGEPGPAGQPERAPERTTAAPPNVPVPDHPLTGTTQVYLPPGETAHPDANMPPGDSRTIARCGDTVIVQDVYEDWNGVAGLTMAYVYVPATGHHTHFSPREMGLPGYGEPGAPPAAPSRPEQAEADHPASPAPGEAGQPAPGPDGAPDGHAGLPDEETRWQQEARRLAHLPAQDIPAAVAALPAADLREIRDILGYHFPELGSDLGPNAGIAHEACTLRLDGPGNGPARPAGRPDAPRHAGAPEAPPRGPDGGTRPGPDGQAGAGTGPDGQGIAEPDSPGPVPEPDEGYCLTYTPHWSSEAERLGHRRPASHAIRVRSFGTLEQLHAALEAHRVPRRAWGHADQGTYRFRGDTWTWGPASATAREMARRVADAISTAGRSPEAGGIRITETPGEPPLTYDIRLPDDAARALELHSGAYGHAEHLIAHILGIGAVTVLRAETGPDETIVTLALGDRGPGEHPAPDGLAPAAAASLASQDTGPAADRAAGVAADPRDVPPEPAPDGAQAEPGAPAPDPAGQDTASSIAPDGGPGTAPAPAGGEPAGPPAGTQHLAELREWRGPARPERLVYPDDTALTARSQGEDGDQELPCTAAGIVPARGDQAPGDLQVVRWADGSHAVLHPALIAPAGLDPYAGLSEGDRRRWELLDYYEADTGTVAYLPATLIIPGDILQIERGGQSRIMDLREVIATAPHDQPRIVAVTIRTGVKKAGIVTYPEASRAAVMIPADHPALAAALNAARAMLAPPAAARPAAAGGQAAHTLAPDGAADLRFHSHGDSYYAETRYGPDQVLDRTYWLRPAAAGGGWVVSWANELTRPDDHDGLDPLERPRRRSTLPDAKRTASAWHAHRTRVLAQRDAAAPPAGAPSTADAAAVIAHQAAPATGTAPQPGIQAGPDDRAAAPPSQTASPPDEPHAGPDGAAPEPVTGQDSLVRASAPTESVPAGQPDGSAPAQDADEAGRPDWMQRLAAGQAVAARLEQDNYIPGGSDHDALHEGLVAARDHVGPDAAETRSLTRAYHASTERRRRQQATVTRRITAAIRATGAISATAELHTQAAGGEGAYRIRMAYGTAEDLGLTGQGTRPEPGAWTALSATLGTVVTVLSMTREPEWTIVTIHTGELPASRPASKDPGRTRTAADEQDGLFPAEPSTQAQPGPGGQDRQQRAEPRRGDDLHAAAGFLAALPGHAETPAGPGFTADDTYLGLFLADLPAEQWAGQHSLAAWHMLNRYAGQLSEAGITLTGPPSPAGAGGLDDSQLTAARQAAERHMTAIWPGLLRERFGRRFVRCDGAGATVMLGVTDSTIVDEAGLIPGSRGWVLAAEATVYPFTALADVVSLADRHQIPVPPGVRALANATAGDLPVPAGSRDTGPAPGEPENVRAEPAGGPASPAGREASGPAPEQAQTGPAPAAASAEPAVCTACGTAMAQVLLGCGFTMHPGCEFPERPAENPRSTAKVTQPEPDPAAAAGADTGPGPAASTTPRPPQGGGDLAIALHELSDSAHQAARSRPAQPGTTTAPAAPADGTSPPGPAASATTVPGPGQADRAGQDADRPLRPGERAHPADPVSDDEIRAAVGEFRAAAAGDLPAGDKDRALAHAFTLAMRRDHAGHHHPAGDAGGDRHEVAYRGPFGTDTRLPACCAESARASARTISGMLARPVSAITAGRDGRRRETVFLGGQETATAATPPADAGRPASPGQPPASGQPQTPATGSTPDLAGAPAGPLLPGAGRPGQPDAPGPAAPLALTGTRPLLALTAGPGRNPASPPPGRTEPLEATMIGRNANDLARQILAGLTPPAERYEIGPADPDQGYGLPVTAFDREAALDTAARLSAGGQEIHVVHVVRGQPRLIAAYIDRRPVPPALITRPGTGRGDARDPARLPARAAPAPAGPVPHATRPLRAAIAAGGLLRPHRL
ncbi:MAG: hypothetical protein ACRDPD_02215, partial [Streptosporangiaceae bacterium]